MVRDDFLVHRMVNAGLFEIGLHRTAHSIAVNQRDCRKLYIIRRA